ncbi:MAG: rod shape-determining protein MreC [Candidatus Falkowbacteria bacterium]
MKKLNSKRLSLIGAVIALLLFLHYSRLLLPVEGFMSQIFNPLTQRLYGATSHLRFFYEEQTDRRDLNQTVKDLEKQVSALTQENAKLKLLDEENQSLRNYLKFLQPRSRHYVMANVIGREDVDQISQIIILDKGKQDGVLSGYAVVNENGHIVGKVLETKDHEAQVCLVTSGRCQLAVAIQNQNRTIGIAKGELGLVVKVDFIPQSEQIEKDQTVITSGLEKSIERGLVVGKITEVIKQNNELWQTARVEPLVNPDNLLTVAVMQP